MATGEALVCKLKNITKIEGADNIVQATMFGETIIVSKDYKEGQTGLLFDCESILSEEFCFENDLYRHNTLNKDKNITGYLEDSRRIRPIKLRGVKCSALFMPIESLSYISTKKLPKEGTQIKEWEEKPICDKYVRPIRGNNRQQKSIKKAQQVVFFPENGDTEHLLRNLHKIKSNYLISISSKIHGTSCRVGMLPCLPRTFLGRFFQKLFNIANKYKFCVGSRHVLKWIDGSKVDKKSSFYKDDIWTESAYKYFYGKLQSGEIIFYEICGFLPSGAAIMPQHDNKKLEKFLEKQEYKDFIKKYGSTTTFSYGCNDNEYKIFVYRIALSTEQGQLIDLSWTQLKNRCDQLGVNYVPEIDIFWTDPNKDYYITEKYWLDLTEKEYNYFPMHIDEGIVIRIETEGLKPTILKSKKYAFKILENIIKDNNHINDLEENN